MGIALRNSIEYIKRNFPELRLKHRSSQSVQWKGRLYANLKYKDIEIATAPLIEVHISSEYPVLLPKVFDVEDRFEWEHKYPDNSLCVATEFDLSIGLAGSASISDYFDKFLFPYFISYESWKRTGNPVFGERSHGAAGVYESLAAYFKVDVQHTTELKRLLSWAAKMSRFIKLFKRQERSIMQQRFALRIGQLRKSGIVGLKRVYKSLEMADEYEKMYYEYMRRIENTKE